MMEDDGKKTIGGEVYETKQVAVRHNKRKFSHIILIGGVSICVLAAAIAIAMYIADKNDNAEKPVTAVVTVKDPTIETIKPLGDVNLSGSFGSAKIDFTFDSSTGRGERHYTLQSDEVYTLILQNASKNDDGSFDVEIKELLKGRIEIGTYTGSMTNGSFTGKYTSSHGVTRDVSLTAK